MNTFTLTIRLGNAAFTDACREQISLILDTVNQRVLDGDDEGKIRDVNGNTCGEWAVS